MDTGKFSCGIFIDLQKAFDTVDYSILLRKLHLNGIRGTPNQWFRSYLSDRKQYVVYKNAKSTLKTVKVGVPQGSVLGPILFILYINDLCNALKYSKLSLFADDTNMLYSDSSLKMIEKRVNIDLKFLFRWLCANKIALNVSKWRSYFLEVEKRNLIVILDSS